MDMSAVRTVVSLPVRKLGSHRVRGGVHSLGTNHEDFLPTVRRPMTRPTPPRWRAALALPLLTLLVSAACGDQAGPTTSVDDPVSPQTFQSVIYVDSTDLSNPNWWIAPPPGVFEIEMVGIFRPFRGSGGTGNFQTVAWVDHTAVWLTSVKGWAHASITAPSSSWVGHVSIDTGELSYGTQYVKSVEFPFGCDPFAGHMGYAAAAGVIEWSPWFWPLPGPSASWTEGPMDSEVVEFDDCLSDPPGGNGGGGNPPVGQYYCMYGEYGLFAWIDGEWVLVETWWEEEYCWFEEAS